MKLFKLDDKWSIVCESVGNRTGFKHVAKLIRGQDEVDQTKIQYYNRTWEAYQFESVLLQLLDKTTFLNKDQKKEFRDKVKW